MGHKAWLHLLTKHSGVTLAVEKVEHGFSNLWPHNRCILKLRFAGSDLATFPLCLAPASCQLTLYTDTSCPYAGSSQRSPMTAQKLSAWHTCRGVTTTSAGEGKVDFDLRLLAVQAASGEPACHCLGIVTCCNGGQTCTLAGKSDLSCQLRDAGGHNNPPHPGALSFPRGAWEPDWNRDPALEATRLGVMIHTDVVPMVHAGQLREVRQPAALQQLAKSCARRRRMAPPRRQRQLLVGRQRAAVGAGGCWGARCWPDGRPAAAWGVLWRLHCPVGGGWHGRAGSWYGRAGCRGWAGADRYYALNASAYISSSCS